MDLMIKNYLERAESEIILSASIKKLSDETEAKKFFDIEQQRTFYSAVISHAYYSIFNAAKAMLHKKHRNFNARCPQENARRI